MHYISTPLKELLDSDKKSNFYDDVWDALEKTEKLVKKMNFISYKSVKNEKVKDIINFSIKANDNEFKKQYTFHKLMELFMAKFLFINNLDVSQENINQFIKIFIGEQYESIDTNEAVQY